MMEIQNGTMDVINVNINVKKNVLIVILEFVKNVVFRVIILIHYKVFALLNVMTML